MNTFFRGITVAAGAAVLTVTSAFAQTSAQSTVNVSANVVQGLTATKVADLAFGTTFPGINKTVAATDATSGQVDFSGAPGAEVSLSFTLPTTLTNGAASLPISYNATSAAYSSAATRVGATTFAPAVGATTRLSSPSTGSGALSVYLGGTVAPGNTQAAGTYSGTATITAQYTGN